MTIPKGDDEDGVGINSEELSLPERRLLVAVIERVINDIVATPEVKCNKGLRVDAWLFLKSDCTGPFSFTWICEYLGLDRDCTYEAIKNATRKSNRYRVSILRSYRYGPK